jgi:hypothetical protein
MLYLSKLESKLDEALSKETRETLTDWIGNKRKKQLNKNKMKAHELRIGNLVDLGNRIAKVIENNSLACVVVDLEETQDTIEDYERTKPIPLTEAWHNKFGVQKNGFLSFEYVLPRKNNIDIRVVFQGDYVFLRQSSSMRKSASKNHIMDDVISIWNKDLTKRDMYVHEWQNLYFALTGEELTFKPE